MLKRSLAGSLVAFAAAALIGCGGGGGGGGSSTNGTSTNGGTFNDTSWIANEGWSGSNSLTLDGTTSSWVAKSVRDTSTNVLQVRARIPADLRTIPGEVYIALPTTATNGQVFTETSTPNAPTTGTRVQFFDYRRLASGGGQIEYNAASGGNYTITVNTITSTHINVTYSASLRRVGATSQSHTTSGTIDVDITSN